jgi:hypothetical protein
MIPIKPALRVRRELTHAPSPGFVALAETVRLDLISRGWTEDRAAWWAGRVAARPELRYVYAAPGLDPYDGGDDA